MTLNLALIITGSLILLPVLILAGAFYYVYRNYAHIVVRIFEERPVFKSPVGKAHPDAEDHRIINSQGQTLMACHIRTPRCDRKGMVLFVPEFGGCRWSSQKYAGHLLEEGYDLFSFDFRNQGESDSQADYQPMQWVTNHEMDDVNCVIRYIQSLSDAPESIGIMGVSRGGGVAMVAAADNPYIKCVITDGAFGTIATMVRFMQKWVCIYNDLAFVCRLVPNWFFLGLAWSSLQIVKNTRKLEFPSVRNALSRLNRPLLMIHGEADSYIRPEIAQDLHKKAPKDTELWMVEKAKHNQAVKVATQVYQGRVSMFFDAHLAQMAEPASMPHRALAQELV